MKQNARNIDKLVGNVNSWWGETFTFVQRTRIKTWKAVLIIAFFAGAFGAVILSASLDIQNMSKAAGGLRSPLMKNVKTKGCVADGLFSGYGGDTDNLIQMVENSECVYLHRSIETWGAPPDFDAIEKNIAKLKNRNRYIIGMFLAEAIDPYIEYTPPGQDRTFDFSKMCKEGSEGFWGEKSCKANFGSKDYRDYLKYITEKAIDGGVQSFLFGQIYFQDNGTGANSRAKEIVEGMREYARNHNKEIVIGAQTNDIDDEEYLRLFDFIEGGVGVHEDGTIEEGPCFSRWWKKPGDRCWALLWHDRFAQKANDVILHLDWSGFYDDDMSIFARMDKETRYKALDNMYRYFMGKNMGFMMPYLAVINEKNDSCIGPAQNFYAPGNVYTCRDEDMIRLIMKTQNQPLAAPAVPTTPQTPQVPEATGAVPETSAIPGVANPAPATETPIAEPPAINTGINTAPAAENLPGEQAETPQP